MIALLAILAITLALLAVAPSLIDLAERRETDRNAAMWWSERRWRP
jgi:hypothetical protein